MKKAVLTDKHCQHAEPQEKRYEMPAGDGLYLVVHPTGRKGWALRYRWAGKTRNLTFTKGYPEMGLAIARAAAVEKLKLLEKGKDPAIDQQVEVKREEPTSAETIAELWLKRTMITKSGAKKSSYGEVDRILKRDILPAWKHRLLSDITKQDIFLLLDKTVDRGAPVLANRMLTIIKRWFKWCAKRDYIPFSPAALVDAPTEEETRERVLTNQESAEIWNATPDLGFPFGPYLRFLFLTGQRRSEVAKMEWAHVDLEKALWTLPRTSTKSKRTHDVPLCDITLELLKTLPRFEGKFIFTTTSGKRPISGFSKAKSAIDTAILDRRKEAAEKVGQDPKKVVGLEQWHFHDLRRTMTTWLSSNGVPTEVCGAILNHAPGSTMQSQITAVYARSKWAQEKRDALAKWAEFVVGLEKPKKAKSA